MKPRFVLLARARSAVLVSSLALVAASVAGCHASSETKAEQALQANEAKVDKQQRAMRELERGDSERATRALAESQEADEKAMRAEAALSTSVAREQRHYSALLTRELAWVERHEGALADAARSADGDAKLAKERDVASVAAWRDCLREDLDAVDHVSTTDAGAEWSALKARVDRDLDQDRPTAVPRTYEKQFGI